MKQQPYTGEERRAHKEFCFDTSKRSIHELLRKRGFQFYSEPEVDGRCFIFPADREPPRNPVGAESVGILQPANVGVAVSRTSTGAIEEGGWNYDQNLRNYWREIYRDRRKS